MTATGTGLLGVALGAAAGLILQDRGPTAAERNAPVESFQRTGDPRQIAVVATLGLGERIVETTAIETDTTVTPVVRVRATYSGAVPAIGILVPATILLREGLGGRAVLGRDGRPVRDLGTYSAPQEPPIDLSEIGIVQRGTFRADGDKVDFEWRAASGTPVFTLAQLRGKTVVLLSRTSFSSEGKMSLLALQDRVDAMSPEERSRLVIVPITLNEDPARAAIARPSALYRPLVAFPDVTGHEAPAILRFGSVPVMWFVGPEGAVRYRLERRVATRDDIDRGLAAAK